MFKIFIIVFPLIFATKQEISWAQSRPVKLNWNDRQKLSKAKALFQEANYNGVVYSLDPLLKKYPHHPEVFYFAGRANLELRNYREAFEQLQEVVASGTKKFKDIAFWFGRAWQQRHEPDSALAWFARYKSGLKKTEADFNDVDYYIRQAENYKKYRAMPVSVTFKKLGPEINTEYEEACPTINAEGTLLVFTSRRPTTTGGQRDPYDLKYFQDIYISQRDTANDRWMEAEPLKAVNTPEHDANMTISPDGNLLFIYKNIKGKTGSGDIWVSREKNGDWTRPREFEGPFNTTYFETSASLSPDGKALYFISERPDGKAQGNGDIWVSERVSRKEWGKPYNLGPDVNTPYDEISVWMHPDGRTLFFASKGHDSMGGYDIFKTEKKDGKWTKPQNLGYPINTPDDEIHFTVTADGKKAYLASRREPDENELNIYELDLSHYQIVSSPSGSKEPEKGLVKGSGVLSVIKGQVLGSGRPVQAEVIFLDEKTGKEVLRIDTDEDGRYFATLEGGRRYKVIVTAENFKVLEESLYLSKREGPQPFTLQRNFLLLAQ
jgi:tetratricopeptide (TPR) repeat protein